MQSEHAKTATVAVAGLGYVGCVTAACLAELGHTVIGIDRDEYKVDCVRSGRAPFYEPGLEEAVTAATQRGLLTATTSVAEGLRDADVVLVCVGTPSERNGNLSVEQLRRVSADIAEHVNGRSKPLVVAIRSTVFPGTCDELHRDFFASLGQVQVVSNPEFLREGVAMQDFREPSLVVVGGHDPSSVESVAALYEVAGNVRVTRVSLRTAEMIKYACNAFHAVKISFANEIGALAERLGVDGGEVMRTLCEDTRLNISKAYLRPGFAFGGSCLPKDLRALVYRAARMDVRLPLLESALPSNREHLDRAIHRVLDAPGRIAVAGLAFKENTDDLRESPVISLLEQLIGKGREVRVWDPHISLDSIYGSNRDFLVTAIPHISRLLERDLPVLLDWADCVVVTQQLQPAVAEAVRSSGKSIIDLSRSAPDRPMYEAAHRS